MEHPLARRLESCSNPSTPRLAENASCYHMFQQFPQRWHTDAKPQASLTQHQFDPSKVLPILRRAMGDESLEVRVAVSEELVALSLGEPVAVLATLQDALSLGQFQEECYSV